MTTAEDDPDREHDSQAAEAPAPAAETPTRFQQAAAGMEEAQAWKGEQIGGQLAAGFTLTHLVEAPHHMDPTARYMPGYIATRAVKPG